MLILEMVKNVKNRARLMTLLFLFCMISSTFFMILPFAYHNEGGEVDFSTIEEDNPINNIEIQGDGVIPNITAIWFNGTPYDPSIQWNVSSYDVVNITANITSDPLWMNETYLFYDTTITQDIGPTTLRFTNTTDINSPPLDNLTINNITLYGNNTLYDFHAVEEDDGVAHVIHNYTDQILIPYSINLTSIGYDNDFDLLDKIEIEIKAEVAFTNNTFAGLQIWNWTSNSLVNVSDSWFNTTIGQNRIFTIENSSQYNITHLVDNNNNSRIELFVKVTPFTNNSNSIAVDYLSFRVKKDPKQGIYSALIPGLPWDKDNSPEIRSPVMFWINATDEDGTNSTINLDYNYSVVDNTPPVVDFSLVNQSFVSGMVQITIQVEDMESGIQNISLSIDKNTSHNESKIWSYADIKAQDTNANNVTFTYEWNVTDFPDYNGTTAPENATHVINFTIWNRAGMQNIGINQADWEQRYETKGNYTVYIDNENPYDPYINVRSNDEISVYLNDETGFSLLDSTITHITKNVTQVVNTTSSVYNYDDNYQTFHNASNGILMPYAIELSDHGINELDDIKEINFTVAANTSASNSALSIFNFTSNSLDNLSKISSDFSQNYTFLITRENLTDFINTTEDYRVELFINASDPASADYTAFVKYIGINATCYQKYEWYSDLSVETNMSIRVGGNDNHSYEQIKVYANNDLLFTWDNSTNLTKGPINYTDYTNNYVTFNSSIISDGIITIKAVVLDNASNENYTTVQIKVDNSGPVLDLNHANNSYFSNTGSWNWLIDLNSSCEDLISEISYVEVRINGTIPTVQDGQKYQVIAYDLFGNETYRQTNATWYEDNDEHVFAYQWNATEYSALDMLNISIYAEDLLGNSNYTTFFIHKSNYTSNFTVERADTTEVGYSESGFYLSILLNNTGNSTLYGFSLTLTLPSGWTYSYQFDTNFNLDPYETREILIYIIPLTTEADTYTIQISVTAFVFEHKHQTDNLTVVESLDVVIHPKNYQNEIVVGLIIFGLIVGGLGLGVFLHFLSRSIKRTSSRLKVIQEESVQKQDKKVK